MSGQIKSKLTTHYCKQCGTKIKTAKRQPRFCGRDCYLKNKREMKEKNINKCKWCGTANNLVLDHIIPVYDGGGFERTNAQTLCQPCNLWKLHNVDQPRFLAGLGSKGGQT